MNHLYYGDNLEIMRNHIADESVDLIYLDPPFNSKATYNVLFSAPSGEESQAQIEAFEDTWHWNDSAEQAFYEVLQSGNTDASEVLAAFRSFLRENDMMAYLAMIAVRALEMERVLRESGSMYLHCDPTASHYLKVLLDAVFGKTNFKNEIIWRRTGAHNKAGRWAPIHDVILFYTKGANWTWNNPRQRYMKGHVEGHFEKDEHGYKTAYYGNVLTGSGVRNGESGKPWRGVDPTAKGRHWAIPSKLWEGLAISDDKIKEMSQHEKLEYLLDAGVIKFESGKAWPIYERYVLPEEGPAMSDLWAYQPYTEGLVHGVSDGIDADVSWLKPQDAERLGYQTQKPVGLLERIVRASSNPGDVVLDPFCGCGASIYAAEKLERQWIGIDVTHLAITLIEKRLKDAFPRIEFDVHGTPRTLEGARELASRDKYQFEWWALSLVGAMPFRGKKRGADTGIDGIIYFRPDGMDGRPQKVIVSVKGGETVGVAMIRDLIRVVDREKGCIGIFLSLAEPTKPMRKEAVSAGYFEHDNWGKVPKLQILTVDELLNQGKKPLIPAIDPAMFVKAQREIDQKQRDLFTHKD